MTARTQQQRAETSNTPPPDNSLLPGQIYLELADPMRIWAGVPASLVPTQKKLIFDATTYMPKTGGAFTGPITLSADPSAATQPATKQYVDTNIASAVAATVTSFNTRTGAVTLTPTDVTNAGGLLTTGGVLSGALGFGSTFAATPTDLSRHLSLYGAPAYGINVTLGNVNIVAAGNLAAQFQSTGLTMPAGTTITLAGDPTLNLQAATKQYVDLRAPIASPAFTGVPAAPTPAPGTNTTQLATTQFVQAAVTSASASYLPISGGTLTGPLTLSGNAVANLQPTTLQQINALLANYLPIAGGTLTGPLNLAADPAVNLAAATKQYVDNRAAASAGGNVGRNLLHNPLFAIAQRGAGPFTTLGQYTLDRWYLTGANDTASVQQLSLSDTDRAQIGDDAAEYTLRNVFTGNAAAGANNVVYEGIERVRRLSGKTVTLSFWALGTSALRIGVNYLQNFGSGGSPSPVAWANPTGQSVTVGTAWARYTITTTIPSTAGKTLGTNGNDCTYAFLAFSSGATNNQLFGNIGVQSGTIWLWGIQLEIGSTATPLEKLDPQQDLANCQRFYAILNGVRFGGYGAAGASFWQSWPLPVSMRANPTVTPGYLGSSNAGGLAVDFANNTAVGVYAVVSATGTAWVQLNVTASADL